jgi:hypothetical protein
MMKRCGQVDNIWNRKYKIIIEIYGFALESWETRITPRTEAFQKTTILSSDSSGLLAKKK